MNRKIFILFCCLACLHTLWAQNRTNLHTISRREGLSNGAVNAIVQDAEGYMWFGTWNGLNRYDGTQMVTYTPGSAKNAIHNHVVREIYPSLNGQLWMLTNKGITLYDNKKDCFYPFFNNEYEQINYENDISLSYSDQHGIKVAVFGRGMFRFDSIARQFVSMAFEGPSVKASKEIKRLHAIGDQLYCLTDSNLLLQVSGNSLLQIMQLPSDETVTSSLGLLVNNRPTLLITRRGADALMVDMDKKVIRQVKIPGEIITSFASSNSPGSLWCGTENGKIYNFHIASREFEILDIPYNASVKNYIAARISTICETEPDLLWIGTDGNGIYHLKLTGFPNTKLVSTQLSYPVVRSLLVTRNKKLLIGTKGGGVDVFDVQGRYLRNISVKDGLTNNSVLCFHEMQDGTIWAGTDGQGIDVISEDLKTIRNFPRDFTGLDNGLSFSSVYRILEDNNQRLYLGTSGYGVVMIEMDQHHPASPLYYEQLILESSPNNQKLQKQIVYALTQERPGVIWIGTRGYGVYQYNTITKRMVAQYNSQKYPSLINNDDILSLFADGQHTIWVGTSAGMYSISAEQDSTATISGLRQKDELTHTSIHTLQADQGGFIWASTNQGLSSIDIRNRTVRNFTSNDGLVNEEYSDGASFFDPATGQLFVGGTMGVDIIRTREIRFSSYFPPIAINELMIRNMAVTISEESVLHSRMNQQSRLELKNNQNSIAFFATPLVYWGKERYRISYRMKNLDDNWTTVLPGQPVSFTNLRADNYTLQLRVSDENGNWSNEFKEVDIIVSPPFWKSNWATTGYIILILGLQWLFIRSYLKRESRRKEAALLELKLQHEKQMHQHKIEFFTNVAHEFRTPLTIIISYIHALMDDKDNLSKNPRLMKVYNNSIKLQKLVLEIIQFQKLEKGKEPLQIRKVNPRVLTEELIADLELMAQKSQVTVHLTCHLKDEQVNMDADKYQRILTNLVSNAIKYNNRGGWVKIQISANEDDFITEVQDNGIGISPGLLHKIFEPFGISSARKRQSFPDYQSSGLGLAVTKGIVELLRGNIHCESIPGGGTRFIVQLPRNLPVNAPQLLKMNMETVDEIILADEPIKTSRPPSVDLWPGKPLLLLVDDDPEILDLLSDMLASSYNLCFAANGQEALAQMEKHRVDLIVSDVMMPVMDGVELCRQIRANFDTSHLPLILLTAKEEIEDRIAGLQAGADSYIPKPFHPDHLKVRIDRLLAIRQNLRDHFTLSEEKLPVEKEIPDPFLQKLMVYIGENIEDNYLSTEKACHELGISKSSLYNKTRSVLGTTPHGLINQMRIKKAAVLLNTTNLSVSEIINQTGFTGRTYFYEQFHKAFDCSPSEYRQKRNAVV